MRFIYKPEGAEPKSWPFQPTKLMSPEAEAIERHTGMTFGEWQTALMRDSMLAIHGFLFVMLKREHPTLKWDEVVFCLDDVDVEPETDELEQARDQLAAKAAAEGLSDDEAEALEALVEQVGPAPEDPAPKD